MRFNQLEPNVRFSSKEYKKYGNVIIFIKMGDNWPRRNNDSNSMDLLHNEEYKFGSFEEVEIVELSQEERNQLEQLQDDHRFIQLLLEDNKYAKYDYRPDEELIDKVDEILGFRYFEVKSLTFEQTKNIKKKYLFFSKAEW